MRTLMLCHSPRLADYLRSLTAGKEIEVYDFVTWVYRLIDNSASVSPTWTHYEEPSDADLDRVLEILLESPERYDAVIVDEGQDFRSEWWLAVEAALVDPRAGILYIFTTIIRRFCRFVPGPLSRTPNLP
ncbi:MAG: hypothetical protein IPK19_41445 [Chloroflexi bacterium]|nr:hypothetical protein [Chloroflexota bacterium]